MATITHFSPYDKSKNNPFLSLIIIAILNYFSDLRMPIAQELPGTEKSQSAQEKM